MEVTEPDQMKSGKIPVRNLDNSHFGKNDAVFVCSFVQKRQYGFMDPDPDADPDPAIDQQKTNLKKSFYVYYFLKVHLQHFSRIISQKEETKQ